MFSSLIIWYNSKLIRTIKWKRLIIIKLGYKFIRQLKQKYLIGYAGFIYRSLYIGTYE